MQPLGQVLWAAVLYFLAYTKFLVQISWVFLNRHTVHGDHALVGFIAASAMSYYYFQARDPNNALILSLELILTYVITLSSTTIFYRLSPFHPLAKYPGPMLWRIGSLPLALVSFKGHRHLVIDRLHQQYGKFVRIGEKLSYLWIITYSLLARLFELQTCTGPNALSINASGAFNTIYGATNHMTKSDSYRLPGRIRGIAMFFQQTREAHTFRKQIWSQAFTSAAYVSIVL
jgi:hypothetical protein